MSNEQEPEYDNVFGELNYDPPMEEWYASVALSTYHEIELTIQWSEEQDGPFALVLKRARGAFQTFLQREASHKELLAAAMLERYQGWGSSKDQLPTPAKIVRGLEVRQIWIAADGSMSVHYRDFVDLFGDHSIMADIDPSGSFVGFSLQG